MFFNSVLPESNPCNPSPCGPNSICNQRNGQAVCSCQDKYFGSPPNCRPECLVNSECSQNRACYKNKCNDPCPGTCGVGAQCRVINHNPLCSCPPGTAGDPFIRCFDNPGNKYKLINMICTVYKLDKFTTLLFF